MGCATQSHPALIHREWSGYVELMGGSMRDWPSHQQQQQQRGRSTQPARCICPRVSAVYIRRRSFGAATRTTITAICHVISHVGTRAGRIYRCGRLFIDSTSARYGIAKKLNTDRRTEEESQRKCIYSKWMSGTPESQDRGKCDDKKKYTENKFQTLEWMSGSETKRTTKSPRWSKISFKSSYIGPKPRFASL